MKTLIFVVLLSVSFTGRAFADPIDPDTARAYEGYLLTFQWPESQSIEQVDYTNLLATDGFPSPPPPSQSTNSAINAEMASPFDAIEKKLGRHVKILTNERWVLIFKQPGDSIKKTFRSSQETEGYPELTGDISIKLGRYLESSIHYQHYLFNELAPLTQNTLIPDDNTASLFFSPAIPSTDSTRLSPGSVLTLEQSNKTASKKINYLDHPTIGTLLYFEPIELADAMEKIVLQTLTPETGRSLTYEKLQSTNELSPR
ncbi:hypothetical protein HGG82_03915 [Marinomonas sp. M1K-6]|uniref:Peptidoglycan-binding protein CsiV n=1 Tax=Marinomonas profundi TaxID=2726122 RepID=A0A847R443_9GAMM|nr:hypothetical protein [Marinomonas profundi]NLQ16766.1 hypothetical protein [Marinomonas profundi]UDV02500.1 hypothetical protein J8N69_13010 [Marinomonas profundi]